LSKIRAYYCTNQIIDDLFSSAQFDKYVSNDPNFWTSTYRSLTHCLVLINGDDRDHIKISNQTGIKSIDYKDLRSDINSNLLAENSFITKVVNNISALDYTDFIDTCTVKGVLNTIIQHLSPGHCPLSFDNIPRPSGTFTDDFTGTNGQALGDRTGWTIIKDGEDGAEISSNQLNFADDIGGGSGDTYWVCTDQVSANQYVQIIDNIAIVQPVYLAIRLVDEDNFIGYHLAGGGGAGARLSKFVAGSLTDSIVTTQGGVGYAFKIECEGTTVRFYRDTGSGFNQVGTDQTIADHQTETSAGFVTKALGVNTVLWDDYENGAIGGVSDLTIILNDLVTAEENFTVALPNALEASTYNEVSVQEFVSVSNQLSNINIVENILVSEYVAVTTGYLSISLDDEVTILDAPVSNIGILYLTVNDEVTVTEYTTVNAITGIIISVADTVTIFEDVALQNILGSISTYDSVAVDDITDVICELSGITVYDSITVNEDVNISVVTAVGFQISVVDLITVTEQTAFFVSGPKITVVDSITVSEAISFLIAFITGTLKIHTTVECMEVMVNTECLEIFAEVV
jgi:hypothetical protein